MIAKFLYSILIINLISCGKKGPPKIPTESILPNYEDIYIEQNKLEEDEENKSKEKSR